MQTFDKFIKKTIDDFRHTFPYECDDPDSDIPSQQPGLCLSTWLSEITQTMFVGEGLSLYFRESHILGSLGESLRIVFKSVSKMQLRYVNLS